MLQSRTPSTLPATALHRRVRRPGTALLAVLAALALVLTAADLHRCPGPGGGPRQAADHRHQRHRTLGSAPLRARRRPDHRQARLRERRRCLHAVVPAGRTRPVDAPDASIPGPADGASVTVDVPRNISGRVYFSFGSKLSFGLVDAGLVQPRSVEPERRQRRHPVRLVRVHLQRPRPVAQLHPGRPVRRTAHRQRHRRRRQHLDHRRPGGRRPAEDHRRRRADRGIREDGGPGGRRRGPAGAVPGQGHRGGRDERDLPGRLHRRGLERRTPTSS